MARAGVLAALFLASCGAGGEKMPSGESAPAADAAPPAEEMGRRDGGAAKAAAAAPPADSDIGEAAPPDIAADAGSPESVAYQLTVDRASVPLGAPIIVQWVRPSGPAEGHWIALFRSGAPSQQFLTWVYLPGPMTAG